VVADKLHNVRSVAADVLVAGPTVAWSFFSAPPADQLLYLDEVIAVARARSIAPRLVETLVEAVESLRLRS